MLEVNPWAITKSMVPGRDSDLSFSVLDTKFTIDESSLYRHKELQEERQKVEQAMGINNVATTESTKHEINYHDIKGDGNIGIMVNGAGMAMATMDYISANNGKPANFMDLSGKVNASSINYGFNMLI